MKRRRTIKGNGHKKKQFKGPYPINKYAEVETTRKYMKSEAEGPTVDEFSYQDTTDSVNTSKSMLYNGHSKRPRKKQKVIESWFSRYSKDIIIGLIIAIITSFVGVVVYNHSNKLVIHEKDIEFLQNNKTELKSDIDIIDSKVENIENKVHEIDKKVEIHDIQINKK